MSTSKDACASGASGNRVLKIVTTPDNTKETHYVRDASGNIMAIYSDGELIEQPIYGSSRVGHYRGDKTALTRKLGHKSYEMSNHLGNVQTVISDEYKVDAVDGHQAVVASISDYYPFGLAKHGRGWSSESYRYGFNGKEKDQNGEFGGTVYDYGFRIYNPSIAKFLSVDPLTSSYPMLTPYQFASNTPIYAIDLDGLEAMPGAEIGGFAVLELLGLKTNKDVNDLVTNHANGRINGALGVSASVAAYYGGLWINGNKINLLYNSVFQNEIVAGVYGTIADDQWILPAVSDDLTKGGRRIIGSAYEHLNAKRWIKSYRSYIRKLFKSGEIERIPGNIGTINGVIDGKRFDLVAGSGDAKDYGIFDVLDIGDIDRRNDSEYKLLSAIANKFDAKQGDVFEDVTGELILSSEKEICKSCDNVITQFQDMFPKVDIVIIDKVE